ncbi:hypothetical protein [Gracilibacillus massiliensis]|nr:hypothetical protein [Gracilibacillus massiliensis]
MSLIERNEKTINLLAKEKFTEEAIYQMTDAQIEYFHWLYFEDSVYDLM